MDLLFGNRVCDDVCNKKECMFYSHGDLVFESVSYAFYDDYDHPANFYAADNRNCAYNVSTVAYSACNASTAVTNVYLDPNVPAETYDICDIAWIGDNGCDDSCRVTECGNDGGDCADGQQCTEDTFCALSYTYWTVLLGSATKINHTDFCTLHWDLVIATINANPAEDCPYYMEQHDYNNDGMLNFRESVPIIYDGIVNDFEGDDARGPQINCSDCLPVGTYNA